MVGVYFYTWYDLRKWSEARSPFTPLIGRYDSADPHVIRWQLDLIEWCGFDYIIIEAIPDSDWSSSHAVRATQTVIEQCRPRRLQWSFLLDAAVHSRNDGTARFTQAAKMVDSVEQLFPIDGMVKGPDGKPLHFVFGLTPEHATRMAALHPAYDFRFAVCTPRDVCYDRVRNHRFWGPIMRELHGKGIDPFDYLVKHRYVSFWDCTDSPDCYDGFCSVIPGYDDMLLGRYPQSAPVVPRKSGKTFVKQFESAISHKAKHITVYGWNEYFEATTIEPTREYGMTYARLAKLMIERAHEQRAS